ncbi:uncharacterized protein N7511_001617 [Penicillium nucicola]|uniref:uncharacterized protein n=1 Tax=Penicillium nucicola TaxID=1850975 RepID=UPI0025450705|nr:uncharacterized protein N7511_001617 [Penicillium nucicola]KAJ5776606.1 hypothetical protein N7511_001617 [Penicillium nucicola]
MSKSETLEISDVNEAAAAPVKPTLWQRFKAHMKRFWWAYIIGFCCAVLCKFCANADLCSFYVGIPNFANDYINKYEYDYDGLRITNPRPTAFHSEYGGGFSGSGHLTAFNATIRTKDPNEVFAVFPVPEIQFSNGASLDIDQDLHLSCVECLSSLATSAASSKNSSLLITGTPDLKFGGLPTAHLNIDKTMNVAEFINTDGAFNVTRVDILDEPVDGFNFNATITVRNPSPYIVELGHVTFNLSMGGSDLGYVDLPYLFLDKNGTTTEVLGSIDTSMLIHEAVLGDDDFGMVTIDVKGNSCDFNGQDIPYFAAAIKAVSASARLDLLKYASSLFSES